MITSKISLKGQVTIPKQVREALGAAYGDFISYDIRDDRVVISRAEPFDAAYHAALADTLSEWVSPEDEEAFGDL
jgi:AbrB family looped-hinge helix DNA binding protein